MDNTNKASNMVSIIVLNWNGKRYLKNCFDSIKEQLYQNYEVIMVDNASTDGSIEYVKRNYPWIKIIRNEGNLGSAGGHNVGIRKAQGELIAMLDNDVVLDRKWLEELVKTINRSMRVGIVGGNVYGYDPPHNPIFFPNRFIPSIKRPWALLSIPLGKGINHEVNSDVIQSCAVLFRKEVFDEIGSLDEEFFFWAEDEDFCLRARRASFKILYNPRAVVWHKTSGWIGRLKKPKHFFHANVHFMFKNFPRWQAILAILFMFISSLVFVFLKINFSLFSKLSKAKGV
jgi:GT2 family glycosyltransferase